jgi:molecular chaperone GrpE
VLRQGFRRGDRVLRSAMVAVTDPESPAPPVAEAAAGTAAATAAGTAADAETPVADDQPAAG